MAPLLLNIPRKQAFIYATFLVLYEFLTYIANDMIMPGMISVVQSFHGPLSAIATSLTFYVLGGASLQILLGPISDRYGRRPVMITGACLFFLCTVLIACSHSMNQFLVARFFQGMGLCFISVIGYTTLQEIFSEMDAIRLISVMAGVSILAPLLGPLFGVFFIYYYDWRMIFVLIGVLSLVALWGLWRFMPESVGHLISGVKPMKPTTLSLKSALKTYQQLCSNRTFLSGSCALGIIYLPCMAWIALSPVMLVTEAHLTLYKYGLWQLPVFGAYIIGNACLHRMTHHFTVKKIIRIGSSIAVASLLLVCFLSYLVSGYFIWLMPGLVLYFLSTGLLAGPLTRRILFSTTLPKGSASALMCLISMGIQALGIEIANYVYLSHNNRLFGLYCAVAGIVYGTLLMGGVLHEQSSPSEDLINR